MADRLRPVFIDYTGLRWRRIRRTALALGVVTTLIGLVLVVSELIYPPMPPELSLAASADRHDDHAFTHATAGFTKIGRMRLAYRRKLAASIARQRTPASRPPEAIPVLDVGTGSRP